MEYLDQIKSLAEKGVDENDETTFGLHGTSIEAIKYLAEHGKMPTTGDTKTQFHFCPTTGVKYEDGSYGEAKKYANINAVRNVLLANLQENGAQLTRDLIDDILEFGEEANADSGLLTSNKGEEFCAKIASLLNMKYTYRFDKLYTELHKNNHGLVLGISPGIRELNPKPGADEDLVVVVPQGLPLQYISGIEPEGKREWGEIFDYDFMNVHLFH